MYMSSPGKLEEKRKNKFSYNVDCMYFLEQLTMPSNLGSY